MKSAVELLLTSIYSTIIKILLSIYADIQESSREDNAKSNFLGVIWGKQKVLECAFSGFQRA